MSAGHKYKRLDSLRGLAAFSVGVGHAVLCVHFSTASAWRHTILGVFNANYAVDMFFVLSGFVLANMIAGFSGPAYCAYLGRRFVRLYPLMWAALLIGFAAFEAVTMTTSPCTGLTQWACHFIHAPSSALGYARLVAPSGNYDFDPVIWTIRIEIEASIAYPLMLFLWRRSGLAGRGVLAAAAVMLAFAVHSGFPHFLFLFLGGIAINDVSFRRGWHATAVLAVGFLLMVASGFLLRGHSASADMLAGASAVMVISGVAYACPRWLGAMLDNRAILRLGELSYSYYLLNGIALWVIARLAERPLSVFLSASGGGLRAAVAVMALTACAAVLGILAAIIANQTIEKPSIRLSRAIERRILQAFSGSNETRGRMAPVITKQ